jgi:hypothetical protein
VFDYESIMVESSKPFSRTLVACLAVVACLLVSRGARAEESIIRHPGDHPNYAFEIEPHLDFAFFLPSAGSTGIGIGGRFTLPIVKNGFVGTINNSVGIGFGLDWLHYNGCYYRGRFFATGYCDNLDSFWIPVVMQWNFFLSTHWSVFGEPGLSIVYQNFGNYYGCVNALNDPVPCDTGNNRLVVEPVIFFGGRYHFSETAALTMRIGWPYASIGVSFMP